MNAYAKLTDDRPETFRIPAPHYRDNRLISAYFAGVSLGYAVSAECQPYLLGETTEGGELVTVENAGRIHMGELLRTHHEITTSARNGGDDPHGIRNYASDPHLLDAFIAGRDAAIERESTGQRLTYFL